MTKKFKTMTQLDFAVSEPLEELSTVDESDWRGLAVLDEKVKPGEYVEVLVDVKNPPNYDWPPLAEVKRSFPTEVFVVLEGEIVDRFPDDKMPILASKIDVNVKAGDLLFEFLMPDCLQIDIRAKVAFPKTTTLRQAADQDHATVSDHKTFSDVVVTLRVFAATGG